MGARTAVVIDECNGRTRINVFYFFFCGLVLFDPPKFLNFCSKVGFWVVGFGEGLGNFDALCVVKGFFLKRYYKSYR